jgi:hypothetical protein
VCRLILPSNAEGAVPADCAAGAPEGGAMDIWQEVRKGLFIADAEVESARFLERVVDMARRNGASLPSRTAWKSPLAGAARRRRRSMRS